MQHRSKPDHSYHEQPRANDERRSLQLPAIVASASPEDYCGSDAPPAEAEPRMIPLFNESRLGWVSPVEPPPMVSGFYHNSPSGAISSQHGHLSSSMMHNPKRAYRQRRKDPSCDACRERKVKCDATETTSCTECSSRNVRCQFTKDTNRRMSSIKQVQDLERQLQETKAQLEQLRAPEHFGDKQLQYLTASPEPDVPEVGRSPRRMLEAHPPQDLSASRTQRSEVGRGILNPPVAPGTPDNPDLRSPPLSSLPSREVAQHCLDSYLECHHRRVSVVHWPQFCRNFWNLYSPNPASRTDRETIALSFAVLALGALISPDVTIREMSSDFVNISSSYMNFLVDAIGIDQGVACFLISIYMAEVNFKSTSYIWAGASIRVAQDKGLHVQGGHWSSIDGELRKRIWYSLYVWDRLIATELGRPMQINDDDCDTELPGLIEEEERSLDPFQLQGPTGLLASVHVARLLAPLARLCRSLCVTAEATSKFEAHLTVCMQFFPPQLRLEASAPLDPLTMAPLLYFQNARILLYRHNMSAACSHEQRAAAIDKCVLASQDTARILSRCYRMNDRLDHVEQRLKASASFLTCTHLWRCMLFLAFRQQWSAFHMLLRFAALVGNSKPVNMNCGRHLSLFLEELIERRHQGQSQNLELDEDLIILLSGDLPAGSNSSVSGNAESSTFPSRRQKYNRLNPSIQDTGDAQRSLSRTVAWDSHVSNEELQQWGGWQRIYEAANWLDEFQRNHQIGQSQPREIDRPSSEIYRTISRPESDQNANTARSRMTIASITDL